MDKSQLIGILETTDSAETQSEIQSNFSEFEKQTEVFSESIQPPTDKPAEPVAPTLELIQITITIPLLRGGKHYASRHVETKLDQAAARNLSDILDALRTQNVKLATGKKIQSTADTVRWIMHQITEAANADRNR